MHYVELFAGAGGLSRGLEAAGFQAMAHAEIEPHARAVLRHHWPDVRLDGDVTQINGADYTGVTVVSGGSPCQDLSVAGKRAGLGGARSGLFYEQVRIWEESRAPYFIWENVYGALSSNAGRDFAAVLSALVGAAIPVPSDGWRTGGVAAGATAVAAWRVLDLQHFGPPQRRVRVFVLAARTGGVDPAEVLALREGVCGHPSPREQSRQRVAGGAGSGAAVGMTPIVADAVIPALPASLEHGPTGHNRDELIIAQHGQWNAQFDREVAPTLTCLHEQPYLVNKAWPKDVADTLTLSYADKWGMENQHINGGAGLYHLAASGRPRRLTPLECERLMSWPDQWTKTGVSETGTTYDLSDTARYRLCGNGVGSVCVEWFATRLYQAITSTTPHRKETP